MADVPKRPGDSPEGDEEEPRSRTGRFHVQHRGGAHVEVGEAIHVGGERPWMCAVKLVGKKRDVSDEDEPTQTLLVRTGRGATAEDARREALSQLTLVYGSPVEPPPSPIISQKPSDPPPSSNPGRPTSRNTPTVPPPGGAQTKSWFTRMIERLRGG
ncbi:MAG TPA: hypothetical protein VGL81_33360 [Polyangiaceae bacterium]|jgi:hypothetical protein